MNSENGARYMKPAMTLLDANMALLLEASTPATSTSASSSTPGHTKIENRSIAGAPGHSGDYSFSDPNLSASSDFTSPSQYSFDMPYYSNQHSADGSVAVFSPLTDAQFQEFSGGIGSDSGAWSY